MFGKKGEGNLSAVNVDKIDTIIGKDANLSGKIKTAGHLRIEGGFDGQIECDRDVIITQSGKVKAQLKAKNAVIAGNYEGNILLEGKLEIKSTGKVTGDIKVATLAVEDGAVFDGKCEMNFQAEENSKNAKKDKKVNASNPT